MIRCVNLDWLEVYAHEPDEPRDAEYFRALGFDVREREYGTRQYNQMFVICDNYGEAWIEVRRDPKGLKTLTGFSVLDEGSCHIRLSNRTCYAKNAAQIMIDFCYQHHIIISRVSRLDICLDFTKFDSGDDPQKFINRYLSGKYSKVNQSNIRANGKDQWDGRCWNSLHWGALKSMVSTKLYNKTLELRERKDKPYIRQAWAAAGLVDDMMTLTKMRPDGTEYNPEVWRLEFSISSAVKKWYVIEDISGKSKKLRSIHNTLEDYTNAELLMKHFAGLVHHYFSFKKFEPNKRKDRCEDKHLFNFSEISQRYEVEHLATAKPTESTLEALRKRLEHYLSTHTFGASHDAAETLLRMVHEEIIRNQGPTPESRNEMLLLQQLVSKRIKGNNAKTLEEDMRTIKAMLEIDLDLF